MKKLLIAALAAVLAMSLLTACGGSSKSRNASEDESTSAPTATAESTEVPTDEPAADEGGAALQTAEEAANDQVTIQNEIDSIKALVEEGLYDDAMMQARALLTKNLTDADKDLIQQYMDQIQSKLGGLTD